MPLPDCTAELRAELEAFVTDGLVTPEQADEAAAFINAMADKAALGEISEAEGLRRVIALSLTHRKAG